MHSCTENSWAVAESMFSLWHSNKVAMTSFFIFKAKILFSLETFFALFVLAQMHFFQNCSLNTIKLATVDIITNTGDAKWKKNKELKDSYSSYSIKGRQFLILFLISSFRYNILLNDSSIINWKKYDFLFFKCTNDTINLNNC